MQKEIKFSLNLFLKKSNDEEDHLQLVLNTPSM